MDIARFGDIKFFTTSEEARPFQLSASASSNVVMHRTLAGFEGVRGTREPQQITLSGVWAVHGQNNKVSERLTEFLDALEWKDPAQLVVGGLMLGEYLAQNFSWSPTSYSWDGTPDVIEWSLTLTEARQ